MIEIIKILLFGGHTVISSNPPIINSDPVEFVFEQPLKALNCSASFNVNISEHITTNNFQDFTKEAESKFGEGCIQIHLKAEDGETVIFNRQHATWGSQGNVSLNLMAYPDLDTTKTYSSMLITSCKALKSSKITWYNHGKISCKTFKNRQQ
jgi:hypothetical protein